jgi:hypothetical protein
MYKTLFHFLLLFYGSFYFSNLNAQNSLNVSGGKASSTECSVSYSFGQVFCTQISGTTIKASLGVQQPYETVNYCVDYEEILNEEICQDEFFYWRGNSYNTQGEYYDSISTFLGCDSIFILNLVIHPKYLIINDIEISQNELPFQWEGTLLSSDGTYFKNYQTSQGCDSILQLNLSVYLIPMIIHESMNTTGNIAYGNTGYASYSVGQVVFNKYSGIEENAFQGVQQPHEIQKHCSDFYEVTDTAICDGDLFLWRGNDYFTENIYSEHVYTTEGCDSNFVLILSVYPHYHVVDNIEITDNDLPYAWQGNLYWMPGIYYAIYQSIYGCDSTLQLNLTVHYLNVKTLSVAVFLEGLYSNNGLMNQAQAESGPQYGYEIADKITVELYEAVNTNNMVYQNSQVFLDIYGNTLLSDVPAILNDEYYIVIRHRNSLETWSSQPVIFSNPGSVFYDFTLSAGQAYGNNMKNMSGGNYAIFGGDINQDGIIDGEDMSIIDNASTQWLSGYVFQDANGDGIVDGSDMALIDNNSTNFIQLKKP